MLGQILKYLLLGTALGTADRSISGWFKHGRERRRQAEEARAMRYLLEHYRAQSFEEDCSLPEFREAVLRARTYYENSGPRLAERKLDRVLAQIEGTAEARPSVRERVVQSLQRERIGPLPLRKKAMVAGAIALGLDVWVLLTAGLGSGLAALLGSLLEAPALLLGLLASPYVGGLILKARRKSELGSDPEAVLKATDSELQKSKRSLYLRLTSSTFVVPEKLKP